MGHDYVPTDELRTLFDGLSYAGKEEMGSVIGFSRSHVYMMMREGRFHRLVAQAMADYFRQPMHQLFVPCADESTAA